MKQTVLVLSASQYQITDEKTGEITTDGCIVRYCLSEDLAPTEDQVRPVKGHVPAKANIKYDDWDSFKVVPALYEVTLTSKIDSQGKVSLAPTSFTPISKISVTRIASSNKSAMQTTA
ncbi:MAG: hypothetical protein FWC13_01830 [Oscillospiraceae bacterium]|nr:hypothetical protein [Oscillospiraceae bacterium]